MRYAPPAGQAVARSAGRTEPLELTRDLPRMLDEGALQDGGLADG
jgi:hypothetical protein